MLLFFDKDHEVGEWKVHWSNRVWKENSQKCPKLTCWMQTLSIKVEILMYLAALYIIDFSLVGKDINLSYFFSNSSFKILNFRTPQIHYLYIIKRR